MKPAINDILFAAALLFLLAFNAGCASLYLGKTVATFETPEGLRGSYSSNKNQESFSVVATVGEDGKIRSIDIKTTATTPEAAMAAALQAQTETLKMVGPLIQKGAMFATKP